MTYTYIVWGPSTMYIVLLYVYFITNKISKYIIYHLLLILLLIKPSSCKLLLYYLAVSYSSTS